MTQERNPGRARAIPLLPRGIVLFESLPAQAVNIQAMAPALQDGAIVARDDAGFGIVLVRDGAVVSVFAVDEGALLVAGAALDRIRSWPRASISAHRLDAAVVDLLPLLGAGTVVYDELRLEWVDWRGLMGDLTARTGVFVVEVSTPAGEGVGILRGGAHILSYTADAIGEPELLDELAAGGTGTVRVRETSVDAEVTLDSALVELFGRPQPVVADHSSPAGTGEGAATAQLQRFAPELRQLARARLHRTADRVERLIDDALAGGASLAGVAATVRAMPVRGVRQGSLEQLADDMLALSDPALGQGARPA